MNEKKENPDEGMNVAITPFRTSPISRGEPNIIYAPWTKAKLKALVSGLADAIKDPVDFAKRISSCTQGFLPYTS